MYYFGTKTIKREAVSAGCLPPTNVTRRWSLDQPDSRLRKPGAVPPAAHVDVYCEQEIKLCLESLRLGSCSYCSITRQQ